MEGVTETKFGEGHLGSFWLLAIINKAAMNIVEHMSLLPVGTSCGWIYAQERYCWIFQCGTFTQWSTTQLLKTMIYEILRQMDASRGYHSE